MKRLSAALAMTFVALTGTVTLPAQAGSSGGSTSPTCMLACNPATRMCSKFARNEVPRGYVKSKYVPPRYKVVKGKSRCEMLICASGGVACQPEP